MDCLPDVMGSDRWVTPYNSPLAYESGYYFYTGTTGARPMFWPDPSSYDQSLSITVDTVFVMPEGGVSGEFGFWHIYLWCRFSDPSAYDGLIFAATRYETTDGPGWLWSLDWGDSGHYEPDGGLQDWTYGDSPTFTLESDDDGAFRVLVNGSLLYSDTFTDQTVDASYVGFSLQRSYGVSTDASNSVHISDVCVAFGVPVVPGVVPGGSVVVPNLRFKVRQPARTWVDTGPLKVRQPSATWKTFYLDGTTGEPLYVRMPNRTWQPIAWTERGGWEESLPIYLAPGPVDTYHTGFGILPWSSEFAPNPEYGDYWRYPAPGTRVHSPGARWHDMPVYASRFFSGGPGSFNFGNTFDPSAIPEIQAAAIGNMTETAEVEDEYYNQHVGWGWLYQSPGNITADSDTEESYYDYYEAFYWPIYQRSYDLSLLADIPALYEHAGDPNWEYEDAPPVVTMADAAVAVATYGDNRINPDNASSGDDCTLTDSVSFMVNASTVSHMEPPPSMLGPDLLVDTAGEVRDVFEVIFAQQYYTINLTAQAGNTQSVVSEWISGTETTDPAVEAEIQRSVEFPFDLLGFLAANDYTIDLAVSSLSDPWFLDSGRPNAMTHWKSSVTFTAIPAMRIKIQPPRVRYIGP